ncbi:MAG TPA: hypothetical protein VK168_11510 [Saprospiraceae bacterium]|nr:hypothetical protein [Saprospiraceae bacterium]
MKGSVYSIYIKNLLGKSSFEIAKSEIIQLALQQFFNKIFEELLHDQSKSTTEELSEIFKDMGGWIDEDFVLKKSNTLEALLFVPSWFNLQSDFVNYYNLLLIEKWHHNHEDIISIITSIKSETSIPYINAVISLQFKYLYLSDTSYASFIRKCMWALADINTEESIALLKKYLESENPVIKRYADEQLRWLDGEKGMRYMG